MDASPPPPPCAAAEAGAIAFFDVETTVPSRAAGTGYALLEFGAILVCPRRLVEVGSYSTLICPTDTSAISPASVRCNGITADTVATAPSFRDVADNVFAVLHGRVWAGHNIVRFDCARIREAFAEIGRPGPEPKGLLDTLPLLTQRFGRRAGDMKMATLASYFGLGQQRHRSLDDVRMNLEVLKYCATVLFLETSFSDAYSVNSSVYESITRNHVNGNVTGTNANLDAPCDLSSTKWNLSSMEGKTIFELNNMAGSSTAVPDRDPSILIPHIEQIKLDPLQTDTSMDHTSGQNVPEMFSTAANPEGSGFAGFLEPSEVSTQCISVCQLPFHQYGFRILLLHKDAPLQLGCTGLRVRFGTSNKFVDYAGRPKLSIVVDVPVNLSQIMDVCDHLAHKSYLDSGGSSLWRPVIKKDGYSDSPTARLNIPTAANGDVGIYSTEIYHREQSGSIQKLVFSRLDPTELDSLFVQGTIIDAFFCLEAFDYQNWAGLRLVAKRLVVHSK